MVTAFLRICYNLLTFEHIIAYTAERWGYIPGYFTSSKSQYRVVNVPDAQQIKKKLNHKMQKLNNRKKKIKEVFLEKKMQKLTGLMCFMVKEVISLYFIIYISR